MWSPSGLFFPPHKGQDSWCRGPQMLSHIPSGANSASSQRVSSLCQDRTLPILSDATIFYENGAPWSCVARPLWIKANCWLPTLSPTKPRQIWETGEGCFESCLHPFCNPRQEPALNPALPYIPQSQMEGDLNWMRGPSTILPWPWSWPWYTKLTFLSVTPVRLGRVDLALVWSMVLSECLLNE